MRIISKHWLSYILPITIFFASCEKEEIEEKVTDKEKPVLNITSPNDSSRVWLTTQVEVEAQDDREISKVVFYLDGEVFGELTEAPYTLNLNTKQYEDGTYELKVVAYDEAGNQQEIAHNIEIFNKLLQINVGESHFGTDWPSDEGWVIVTDVEGNLIGYEPLTNGQTVVINRPEGLGVEKVNCLIVKNVSFGVGNKALIFDQYNNISPIVLNLPNHDLSNIIGTAKVFYTIPAGYDSHSESFWNGSSTLSFYRYHLNWENDSEQVSNLSIDQEPAGFFVSMHDLDQNKPPRFVLLDSIIINENYYLGINDFQEMELSHNVTLPEHDYSKLWIYGRSKKGNKYQISYPWNFVNKRSIPVYISEPTFKDFSYKLSFELGDKSYDIFSNGKPRSQYSFPNQELKIIEETSSQFSALVTTENLITYGKVEYSNWYMVGEHQHANIWSIYTNVKDTLEVKQIVLPPEIKNKYPELEEHQPEYSYTQLISYKDLTSLEDYLRLINHSDKNEGLEHENMWFFSGYENGRMAQERTRKEKMLSGQLW